MRAPNNPSSSKLEPKPSLRDAHFPRFSFRSRKNAVERSREEEEIGEKRLREKWREKPRSILWPTHHVSASPAARATDGSNCAAWRRRGASSRADRGGASLLGGDRRGGLPWTRQLPSAGDAGPTGRPSIPSPDPEGIDPCSRRLLLRRRLARGSPRPRCPFPYCRRLTSCWLICTTRAKINVCHPPSRGRLPRIKPISGDLVSIPRPSPQERIERPRANCPGDVMSRAFITATAVGSKSATMLFLFLFLFSRDAANVRDGRFLGYYRRSTIARTIALDDCRFWRG